MYRNLCVVLIALTLGRSAPSFADDAVVAEPTIEELLIGADDAQRGESSKVTIEMHVKTKRYERTMRMQSWARGPERTLIRILSPARDAGITTLKVDDNLWNYLPKVDRTMKVPAGMMSGAWMGSHFSNDDLVKDSRLSEDFIYTMISKPPDNADKLYIISLVPKPDAPVVWGKIVARIRPDKVPVDLTYYDERDQVVRTMVYSDVKDIDGRLVPATMLLTPAGKPGEFTRVSFIEMDFKADVPESMFTLQELQRR